MSEQIMRVRLTHNVKQLKKYVDRAIELGAEKIAFDMDKENPYFIFSADFTPEQQNEYDFNKLKKDFTDKITILESRKFKTYSFRTDKWGLCGAEITQLVNNFKKENNIKESMSEVIKQVITDEYDDFDDEKQTVFVTEIL